jgi:hypothetical protein
MQPFRRGNAMTKARLVLTSAVTLLALAAAAAYAHNAICDCFDNGDDTITCEGGFSDGGKAAGVAMRVLDQAGKVLLDGKMSENSDFTFARPAVDFRVEFDAGQGHVVTIDGRDIEE